MTRSRQLLCAVLVVTIVSIVLAASSEPVGAQTSDRDRYLANMNALRASLGLNALQLDPELTALAQDWAEHMAATEQLEHPPDIRVGVSTPWLELGDNTARGSTFEMAWDALINSPVHYYNLTHPTFTHVGIGVAWSASGVQYTHEWFMTVRPVEQAPPEAPAPEPEPEAVPPPSPEPEPPAQVLGTVELAPVNLAVIPLVEYGQAAGVVEPVDPSSPSSPIPSWLFAVVVAALLLALAALAMWQQRRRAPS
jgi:hypothetical protein